MEEYILLGGGGFALELYQCMSLEGKKVKGYFAKEEDEKLSKHIPWLGYEENMKEEELDKKASYLIAVRLIKLRKKLIQFIDKHDLIAGSFISKEAYCSQIATIGKGMIAFPRAMITGNPVIGDYFFIDSLALVAHGDIIGNNVVVGPAAIITGDCIVGDNTTFGVNSCCLPGTKIGSNVEIGIGTYPQRRVPDNCTVIGQRGKKFSLEMNSNFN